MGVGVRRADLSRPRPPCLEGVGVAEVLQRPRLRPPVPQLPGTQVPLPLRGFHLGVELAGGEIGGGESSGATSRQPLALCGFSEPIDRPYLTNAIIFVSLWPPDSRR